LLLAGGVVSLFRGFLLAMSSLPVAAPTPARAAEAPSRPLPFRDPALPLAARLDDLVGRLTLAEKVSQLVHENVPIERLGLPAYNWWSAPPSFRR
jgi:hypothetical protein